MKKPNLILTAAMTGIIGAAINMTVPITAAAADGAVGKCWGANDCKGKGACGTRDGKHDCAGKNTCKGKGWVEMTKKDCQAKHGKKFKADMWEEMKG